MKFCGIKQSCFALFISIDGEQMRRPTFSPGLTMKDKIFFFKASRHMVNSGTIATPSTNEPLTCRPLFNAAPRPVSSTDSNYSHQGDRRLYPRKNFLSAERVAIMQSASRQIVSEKLYWRGPLTQSMSMDLGGELLNALKECDTLTVNLEEVKLLDYSCLVILCAVKRQANEKGKVLLLEGVENPAVLPVIQHFRSNGNRLCRTYCGDRCLFD